jgi:hypothetical protein
MPSSEWNEDRCDPAELPGAVEHGILRAEAELAAREWSRALPLEDFEIPFRD